MQFYFTDEQEQFREFVRRFFNDITPTTAIRQVMESEDGYDPIVWKRLCDELSLVGLCIPEVYGGSGFGIVELGIACEEMGRALYPSPFFASAVLAAKAVELVGTQSQKSEILPRIASGQTIATLAFLESDGAFEIEHPQMQAVAVDDGFVLNGVKKFVLDGCVAGLILATAMTSKGLSLFQLGGDAQGLQKTKLQVIDPTRTMVQLEFTNVTGELIGADGGAREGLAAAMDISYVALANESVGGASRLFEDTLEYTKLRRQFGRAIASFQAIKHRMAEFLLSVELAKSAAYYAAAAADAGSDELSMLASLAKASASEAYLQAGIDSIQLHGGIGFTWENDTHLWFKRAKSSEVFLGDPSWHRRRMIEQLSKGEGV